MHKKSIVSFGFSLNFISYILYMRKRTSITQFSFLTDLFLGYSPRLRCLRPVKLTQKASALIAPNPSARADNIIVFPGKSGLTKKTKSGIIAPVSGPAFGEVSLLGGCGGTGRRAGLRSLWDQTRGGSTPLIRSQFSALFPSYVI
jgi:hypothetical protein